MDLVLKAFHDIKWHYGPRDDRARAEMTDRIAARARKQQVLKYGEVVEGIRFQLANVNGGMPFYIGGSEWSELDRAILGDFLGYISLESYEKGGGIASAVVVSKATVEPSEGFRTLMRQLGLLRSSKSDAALMLWSEELAKAYEWYANH